MKTTTLGPNGPKVSQFGIGAMSFAGIYGDATEAESHAVLDACREAGVTHIDTANVYGMGKSEKITGAWFKNRQGARGEMLIATKAGISSRPTGLLGRGKKRVFDNSPEHLESELDKSLSRLGIDAVDLFYVHRREEDRPIEEVAGTLKRLIDKGKAKAIGFSEIAPTSLARALTEAPVAAVQSEYSLSTRSPEMGLCQACAKTGVSLVAYSPIGRSLLTDAPFTKPRLADMPFLSKNPRFMEPNYSANIAASKAFAALASDMGLPAAGLAIAWLVHQGDRILPIPGTKNLTHLKELLTGMDRTLSESDIARIEDVLPIGWAHGDRYNQGQWVGPERYC